MAREKIGRLVSLAVLLLGAGCDFLMVPQVGGGAGRGQGDGGVASTAMTRLTHEKYFPIGVGPHEKADCNSCHGGFATFKQFSCVSCHEHAQDVTDPVHKGVTDYKFESSACLSCHPQGLAGELSRVEHTKFFPIEPGTPHETGQCADCHTTPGDKKLFTCLTCHDHAQAVTDTAHKAVTDYKYESPSCLSCHPQGLAAELSRPDHRKFFPIESGTPHQAGQCADCHTTPGDRKQFSCLTCHDHAQTVTDTAHKGITDYKYQSPSCLSCHPQGLAAELPRADHKKFFPIEMGTAHGNTQCAECHTTPGDRSQFACIACHDHEMTKTNNEHKSVANYKYDSPSCYSCHKDGSAVFDHATLPSPPNCIGCHMDDLSRAITTPASMHTANNFPKTCESCHKSFTAWGPKTPMDHNVVGALMAKCETCHLDNQKTATKTLASNHLVNKFPVTCGSCHKSFTSWGPGTAMPHAVVGGTTSKCETCHIDNFNKGTTPFNHTANKVSPTACNQCHKDFTSWLKFNHPSNCFNGTTLRGHEGATCAQCHTVPTDYSKSSCTACHQNRGTNCDD